MDLFESLAGWKKYRTKLAEIDLSLGIVPTMGALHKGHASLIERSKRECSKTLVSIFVNPTQFDNQDDLKKYPKTWDEDLNILEDLGVDALLYPSYKEIYPDDYQYSIHESMLSSDMEGAYRKGHFDGVLTVVLKLLILSRANKAYFGEKDYQQYMLVKGLSDAFLLDTEIVSCPIIREKSGLALSSRNQHLADEDKIIAAHLFKEISSDKSMGDMEKSLEKLGFDIEYIVEKYKRRFVACNISNVRLIDNVSI